MSRSAVRRFALLLLAVVWATPLAPAIAQEPNPLSKLDPESRFQIELILDSARTLGIPTRPLLSKTYLGISRGAKSRDIVKVVRAFFNASKDVHPALGPSLSEDEFTAAATAIYTGVPASALSKFRPDRAGKPLLRVLVVLGDLITRGVPRDEASSTMVRLWKDGAGDSDFYGLWKGVEQDILSGQNPGTALQQRARDLSGRSSDKVPQSVARPPEQPQTPSS